MVEKEKTQDNPEQKDDDNKKETDDTRIKEFRDQNIDLKKQNDDLRNELTALTKKVGGIDVDEYKKVMQEKQDVEDKKLVDAGEVEELIERKIKSAIEEKNTEIDTLNSTNSDLQNKVNEYVIDNEVIKQANKNNIHNAALSDIMVRARTTFKVEGDNAIGYDSDGEKIYGKEGDPITINEWMNKQTKIAPHLFKTSTGGNALGGNKNAKVTVDKSSLEKITSGLEKLVN